MSKRGNKGAGGKKGKAPQFTRQIPKFLREYEHLLGRREGYVPGEGEEDGPKMFENPELAKKRPVPTPDMGDDGSDNESLDEVERAAMEEYQANNGKKGVTSWRSDTGFLRQNDGDHQKEVPKEPQTKDTKGDNKLMFKSAKLKNAGSLSSKSQNDTASAEVRRRKKKKLKKLDNKGLLSFEEGEDF
mmetsp:Transcript_4315/g.6914  ORF Transcript_4315/g.6914 Transcript_4315/m.6914 type:complete len:187 (+) Transcript_4315:203-763(+)|eukprot:CAMPEP_0194571946 /NCGR_PEP_ID=MMETSP0292-20121207/8725_1 /TAXON_ID=39354 /ORGANISM="Heterosigma akashiwo, Strain CCMP2393" /LENGTH=186 /DNA_ID=CAMNT_0039422831 /DNA_START=206 /DNA_END=766 /DNA_ORIENTATION=+